METGDVPWGVEYISKHGQSMHAYTFGISLSSLISLLPSLELTMQCGNRTIPETIDALSIEHPERVWARYLANSDDFDLGICQSVTFSVLARAIDTLVWQLQASIPAQPRGSTVLYIGPSDIRYYIIAAAACKYNLKVSNLDVCNESNANVVTGALLFSQE
jgi:hypothetical protein